MPRQMTLPPPRTPDPLFDDFIPPRLVSLMRRVQRRGQVSPLLITVMISLLDGIDPRLEPLVEDVVHGADSADGSVTVFMDLVGPEVAVGAALVFKLSGARPEHVDLAWRLAEQTAIAMPGKGTASEIAERLLPPAFVALVG